MEYSTVARVGMIVTCFVLERGRERERDKENDKVRLRDTWNMLLCLK